MGCQMIPRILVKRPALAEKFGDAFMTPEELEAQGHIQLTIKG
jgi:hypothetical protein